MTKVEQRKLLRAICNHVRDAILAKSRHWPKEWNGHELRELVAYAHEFERTQLMREDRKRRKAARNDIIVNNLY